FDDSDVPSLDRWQYRYMHVDDPRARERWDRKEFEILRKPPEVVMAQRRIVYDNDHPIQVPDYLKGVVPARWSAGNAPGWVAPQDRPTVFEASGAGPGISWLRYRNVVFWKTYCMLLIRSNSPASATLKQWARERYLEDREDRNEFGGETSDAALAAALER